MRDAVDAWVEQGGRVARFAGNFLWQVRLENNGQQQVCHKYFAATDDPVADSGHQALLTGTWEVPDINRPGAWTFGVNGLRGVYAGLGNCIGRGAGFTVYRPQHWAFADTHIGYGDVLGADARIFGYEVDGLEYTIRHRLPYATGELAQARTLPSPQWASELISRLTTASGERRSTSAAKAPYGKQTPCTTTPATKP